MEGSEPVKKPPGHGPSGARELAPEARRELTEALVLALDPVTGLELERDAPLANRTTLRIGGPADLLVTASSETAVAEMLARIRSLPTRRHEKGDSKVIGVPVPLHVLGQGANVLFPDDGMAGIVLRLAGELTEFEVDETVSVAADPQLPARSTARTQNVVEPCGTTLVATEVALTARLALRELDRTSPFSSRFGGFGQLRLRTPDHVFGFDPQQFSTTNSTSSTWASALSLGAGPRWSGAEAHDQESGSALDHPGRCQSDRHARRRRRRTDPGILGRIDGRAPGSAPGAARGPGGHFGRRAVVCASSAPTRGSRGGWTWTGSVALTSGRGSRPVAQLPFRPWRGGRARFLREHQGRPVGHPGRLGATRGEAGELVDVGPARLGPVDRIGSAGHDRGQAGPEARPYPSRDERPAHERTRRHFQRAETPPAEDEVTVVVIEPSGDTKTLSWKPDAESLPSDGASGMRKL